MSNLTINTALKCKMEIFNYWQLWIVTSVFVDTRLWKTKRNVSKISVSLACYWQIGSKSTDRSLLAWRTEGLKVTLVAMIGGFQSDLSITRQTGGNWGNVSVGLLFSKVAYQRKRWKYSCEFTSYDRQQFLKRQCVSAEKTKRILKTAFNRNFL